MNAAAQIQAFSCGVCGANRWEPLALRSSAFPTRSRTPEIHEFENHVCGRCGVIATIPQISSEAVARYYNADYRRSAFALDVGERVIEPPVQMPWSGVSFQRFATLLGLVDAAARTHPDARPQAGEAMIDVGAYQGMFLHAARQAWGIEGIACDYSEAGIAFARRALGFDRSFVVEDLLKDAFPSTARFVSLVHVFEHLPQPRAWLQRVREELLPPEGGYLYLEVPNAAGHPLDDPTHVYMYNAKTLEALLASEGFEIVASTITGYPDEPFELAYGGPEQNLAVLARGRRGEQRPADWSSVPSVESLRRDIRRGWSAAARGVIRLRLRRLLRDGTQLIRRCLGYLLRDLRG